MGNHHSKENKGRHSKRSSIDEESLALSADSLDLIYIDDYFDDARYLKLVARRLAEKERGKKGNKNGKKKAAFSDTAISSKYSSRSTLSHTLRTQSSTSRRVPSASSPSSNSSNRTVTSTSTSRLSRPKTTTSASKAYTTKPSTVSFSKNVSTKQSQEPVFLSTSTSKRTLLSLNASKRTLPSLSIKASEKAPTSLSRESTSVDTTVSPSVQFSAGQSSSMINTVPKQTKPLHPKLTQSKSKNKLRKQRSATASPLSPHTTNTHLPQKSRSVATDRFPASSSIPTRRRPPRPMSSPGSKNSSSSDSLVSTDLKPVLTRKPIPKKKLVVRGLRNYINTHRRDSSSFSSSNNNSFDSFKCKGCPDIWKREFPSKSKFHPDNFIYDWAEGPKAPPRPFSAMAKCKKHGGRCNDCGLFTCDLCQSCRKCETDCTCPCPERGSLCSSNPYSPAGVYQEIFGDDNWNKARKVIYNATEQDKMHPVGGNAYKKKLSSGDDVNWAKDNFYKSQIDVLNPYKVPLSSVSHPVTVPPQFLQHPMFVPPMCPMQFMPLMAMPPPMMPYYPPPPHLQCFPYDPRFTSPPSPYPLADSFLPTQNY